MINNELYAGGMTDGIIQGSVHVLSTVVGLGERTNEL